MRSHQDSLRQAFTACLRFTACEFIFASRPLRFTTYHFVPLFACLYVAGAGGASCTTRRRARAAQVAGARGAVGVRGGTFRLRFVAVGSCIGSSVVGSVCVFMSARLRRRVAPLCSYHYLFVGLVLARARCVIASGASRSRCCFPSSFSVSPRGYHHGTRLNDDPRSFSCLSARHLIMAR